MNALRWHDSPCPADPATAQRAWHGMRWHVWHDTLRAYLLDILEEDPPAACPSPVCYPRSPGLAHTARKTPYTL